MTKSSVTKLEDSRKECSSPSTGPTPMYVEYKSASPQQQQDIVLTVISYMVTSPPSGLLMTRFTVSGDPFWWREYSVPSGYEVSEWPHLPQSVLKSLLELYALSMGDIQPFGTMTTTLDMWDAASFSLVPTLQLSSVRRHLMNAQIKQLWNQCSHALRSRPAWEHLPTFPGRPEGSTGISADGVIRTRAEHIAHYPPRTTEKSLEIEV